MIIKKSIYRNYGSIFAYVLIFIWTFGICLGMTFASMAELDIASWMCAFQNSRVSILSLLILTLFPFILSLFALRFRQFWIIFLMGLMKSFISGYWRGIGVRLFANAGWLINFLLFFTDTFALFLLLLYWFYGFFRQGEWTTIFLLCASFICCSLCLFDWWFISPVLVSVLA